MPSVKRLYEAKPRATTFSGTISFDELKRRNSQIANEFAEALDQSGLTGGDRGTPKEDPNSWKFAFNEDGNLEAEYDSNPGAQLRYVNVAVFHDGTWEFECPECGSIGDDVPSYTCNICGREGEDEEGDY